MDWFLYDKGLRHERVKDLGSNLYEYNLFKYESYYSNCSIDYVFFS